MTTARNMCKDFRLMSTTNEQLQRSTWYLEWNNICTKLLLCVNGYWHGDDV